MNNIRSTQALNKRELELGVPPSASWHRDFADTAFIYIGGLPLTLSEGDIVTIFSQFGEPVFVNLVRDKETGKSKGFAFLKYEDQRSTDLAVDNLGGATIMGKMLNVDHTRYKKRDGEEIVDNTGGMVDEEKGGSTSKAQGNGKRRERSESVHQRPMLREEIELASLLQNHDDDDPMKDYIIQEKREQVNAAIKAYEATNSSRSNHNKEKSRDNHSHRHRSHKEKNRDTDTNDMRRGDDSYKSSRRRRSRERSLSSDSDFEGRHSQQRRRDVNEREFPSRSRERSSKRDRSAERHRGR